MLMNHDYIAEKFFEQKRAELEAEVMNAYSIGRKASRKKSNRLSSLKNLFKWKKNSPTVNKICINC